MTNLDIIRAWKDEDYRSRLDPTQLSHLPASPVGRVELSDADLGDVAGGAKTLGKVCIVLTIDCSQNCSSWGCPQPS